MLQSRNRLGAAVALVACLFAAAAQGQGVQNIEITQPIVRRTPLSDPDDYFGYQVVLHQTAANVVNREDALDNAR